MSSSPHFEQLKQPKYRREQLKSRIVHIGCGAFHRAHQALYTHEWLNQSLSDWGICEVSLMGSGAFFSQLRAQDELFTVMEKGSSKTEVKLVGAVTNTLHAGSEGKEAVLNSMAHEDAKIVSLTITEKGYCIDAATGKLDRNNALIQHDLEHPREPDSAIGYIVESLRLRKEQGKQAFTVLSCDNVQENGKIARSAIVEFASLLDSELALWIELNATFPCTMVDRIVPAATEETYAQLHQAIGEHDPCGIACEPFRQWVIEDNFVAGRPNWDQVGAEFVVNVVPYEEMKLRMLNGSHSFLAYLGYLAGHKHISDTMQDPHFRVAAFNMMTKAQAPTLDMPAGTNLEAYALKLIERFSNQSLKHQTWQIAMDGSQKIPQRFGASIRYHLQHDTDYRWLALAIAGWMRYVYAKDEQGELIEVVDPMVDTFQDIYIRHGLNAGVVAELLSLESIFGADLSQHKGFVTSVTNAYQLILDRGAAAAVALLEQ